MNGPFGYGPVTATFGRFVPFDTARPVPSAEDKAEAARIIAELGPCDCPVKQAGRVEAMARIVQQKRLLAEPQSDLSEHRVESNRRVAA